MHVFTGLRKLQRIFQQKITAMPLVFNIDIEQDPIYIDGLEQGLEQGIELERISMIEKLLLKSDLSIERIADIAGVTIEYVNDIRKKLETEKKI